MSDEVKIEPATKADLDAVKVELEAVKKQQNNMAAFARKITKKLEVLFGFDMNLDGKVGILLAGLLGVAIVVGADTLITGVGTNYPGIGTYQVTSDGTNATLTVDVIVAGLTNIVGENMTGNIPVASITNAANSVGGSIGGNIPQAAITNALLTAGPKIGGNIPVAALTNVLGATRFSGTITNASTISTNLVVVVNGIVVSITTTP